MYFVAFVVNILYNPDVFCCICGEYTLQPRRRRIDEFVEKFYPAYFGVKLGDQDKSWAPYMVCKNWTSRMDTRYEESISV